MAELGARERRAAGEIAREEESLRQARRAVADAEDSKRRTGQTHTREQREERARFLDAQTALPRAGRADGDGRRRDYAALAGLAGHGRAEYERLDPRKQREARLQIDRELAMRRELGGAAADAAAARARARRGTGSSARRTRSSIGRSASGCAQKAIAARAPPEAARAWTPGNARGAAAARTHARRRGSPVLDDAREVAARRKRQLGRDRR